MTDSVFLPLNIPPGVVKTRSPEGAEGRYSNTQNVRFKNGKAEKRGGFTQLNSVLLAGVARGMAAWNNPSTGAPLYAVGTEQKLYGSTTGIEPTDITPLNLTATIIDDGISTVAGSGQMRAANLKRRRTEFPGFNVIANSKRITGFLSNQHPHGMSVGDTFTPLQNETLAGTGITLVAGTPYTVITVPNAYSWTFDGPTASAISGSGIGTGNVIIWQSAIIARDVTITTTLGSRTATVNDTAHPFAVGDTVTYPNIITSGGLSIQGDFVVQSVSTNSYTIRLASRPGTGTTSASGVSVASNWHCGDVIRFYESFGEIVGGISLNGDFVVVSQESTGTVVVMVPSSASSAITSVTVPANSRTVTLTTTSASPTVTVNDTATPAQIGDIVNIPSTAVGGITVVGQYSVVSIATNTFTITHQANASSGATSGSITANIGHSPTTLTLAWPNHGLLIGDKFDAVAAPVTSGILISGQQTVVTAPTANSITISVAQAALAAGATSAAFTGYYENMPATDTVTLGGDEIPYTARLSNALSTVNLQPKVTVAYPNHGHAVGDIVIVSGASAIGGITPNGTFAIATVPDLNSFTYNFTSNATSTVNNAGGTPFVEFLISTGHVDSLPGSYDATSWSISPIGEDAAANVLGGGIYYWDSSSGSRALVLSGAPSSALFICQTDERILHALGINGNPLRFAWADRDQPNDWISTETNLANEGRNVQQGSRLVAMVPFGNGLNLIWTDTACYTHQFTGSAFVYDTRVATNGADNSGLIGPHAFARTPMGVFWMSPNGFKAWSGAVLDIPNNEDIRSWVFERLNRDQQVKCHAVYDHINNSIDFYYVPLGQTEPTQCVTVNLTDYSWANHTETRTTGATFNQGGQNPYKVTTDGKIMKHEVGVDANGVAADWSFTAGPIELNRSGWAEWLGYDPDFKRQVGDVLLTVSTYDRNSGNTVDTQTVTLSTTTEMGDIRASGRHFIHGLSQSGILLGDFVQDTPKAEVKMAGKRR